MNLGEILTNLTGTAVTIGWAALFVVFVVVELGTFQLVSIWLAVGALAAMFMSIFGLPFWSQLLVFALASVVLLVATRPIVRKMLKDIKPTNAELDIGKNANVVEEIDNRHGKGRVCLNGVYWAARSYDNKVIPVDSVVKIMQIDGSKLIVDKDGD